MSKVLKWLETESERLEKECDTNDDQFKTVNHSFIQGFNYALANVEVIELEESKLNENQQIVLNRLKNEGNACSPIGTVSVMMDELEGNLPLYYALSSLKRKEHAQILRTFAEWVIEQEESK